MTTLIQEILKNKNSVIAGEILSGKTSLALELARTLASMEIKTVLFSSIAHVIKPKEKNLAIYASEKRLFGLHSQFYIYDEIIPKYIPGERFCIIAEPSQKLLEIAENVEFNYFLPSQHSFSQHSFSHMKEGPWIEQIVKSDLKNLII